MARTCCAGTDHGGTKPPGVKEVRILGIKVHAVTMAETVETIHNFVRERTPHLVVTLGTEMVMAAQHNTAFRSAVESAALVVPDTVGLVWAARRLGRPLPEKVPGVDLVARLCQESGQRGLRLFFLGAQPGVAEEAANTLRGRYPDVQIVGTHHGYFKDAVPVLDQIKASGADVLLLALGSPRQELFYWDHRELHGVPVGIGVGGSLDVFAGRVKRAPVWMQKSGTEWLYRLISQPSRFKRMLVLPRFALEVLRRGAA